LSWPLLKRSEIMRGDAVEYVAIRRSLLFEKTLVDELSDGPSNFWRPFLDAGVEDPPMKDAVDGVLCIRMPGQIIENFWRWRWKQRLGRHIGDVNPPLKAIGVPVVSASSAGQYQLCASGGLASFNSSSQNALAQEDLYQYPNTHLALHSRAPVRTILPYHPGEYSLPISW
jgi:hypothetical protein